MGAQLKNAKLVKTVIRHNELVLKLVLKHALEGTVVNGMSLPATAGARFSQNHSQFIET